MTTVTVLVLGAGCGETGTTPTPITARTAPPALSGALLTAARLNAIPGAPSAGFERQAIDRAALTVDPDQRDPCGARVESPPSFQEGALAVFASPSPATLVQWVNRLAPGRAKALIGRRTADAHPGCAEFVSTTSTGATQRNRLLRVVALRRTAADESVAVVTRLRQGRRRPVYAAGIELGLGDCLMDVVAFSLAAPTDRFVRRLADDAAAGLRSASGSC